MKKFFRWQLYAAKYYFAVFLLTVVIAGCVNRGKRKQIAKRPDVVVILTDDQGWGDLSINGNTNLNTPNVDRLAKDGASFKWFYVCPVCSPTRAEFLTGRYSFRSGVHSTSTGGERMDLDETTIAQVFKKAGYATAVFGKWHNGMQPPYHPNARGFDEFYGFCSGHWGNYFSPLLEHNGRLVKGHGYITDDLTEHAMDFITENKDHPFFVYLAYNTPHSPMQVPDMWWNKLVNRDIVMRNRNPGKEDIQFTKAALAMCENIDWNVGRLLKRIVSLGLKKNTIVVYFSDNGPNSWRWNGGMKGKKGWTDEGGLRSPLFIRWPGIIKAGTEIRQIAGDIDLLPTLEDMCGITVQHRKPLDGISLKPFLYGQNKEWPDRMIFTFWRGKTSLRTQEYRLDTDGNLFDIIKDPGQDHNISEEKPEVTARLKMAVSKWKTVVTAELPAKDNRPFTLGDPVFRFTQLPARDGVPHGHIKRSNRWPNCSFFTNWTSTDDSITWDVEVLKEGDYEVTIYYTCPEKDVGSTFVLRFGADSLSGKITGAYDPPLRGMEHDRVKRMESYVKDFKPLKVGTIHFKKGRRQLTLRASNVPGSQVMDFRLMMFNRIR